MTSKGKIVEIWLKYLKTLKSQYGPVGANNVRGRRDISGQKNQKRKTITREQISEKR